MASKMDNSKIKVINKTKAAARNNEEWKNTFSDLEKNILELLLEDKEISEIATQLGVHYTTVYNTIFGTSRKKPMVERILHNDDDTDKKLEKFKKVINDNKDWKAYLTEREITIAELYLSGKSIPEIAEQLGVEYVTVFIILFGSGKNKLGVIDKVSKKHASNKKHFLINLLNEVPEWENYVSEEQKKLIEELKKGKTIRTIADEQNLSRTWVNAKLFGIPSKDAWGALQQIQNKELREGNRNIKRLKQAIQNNPDYRRVLNENELNIVDSLIEGEKTLKDLSEQLDLSLTKLYLKIYSDDPTSILYKIEHMDEVI